MIIKEITDRLLVARWILNSDSNYKDNLLVCLMSGKSHVLHFSENKMTVGWVLYHYKGAGVFIDWISCNGKAKEILAEAMKFYEFKKITMMTTRPKAWGRLMGFKPIGTIMEKEITDEDLHEGSDRHEDGTRR